MFKHHLIFRWLLAAALVFSRAACAGADITTFDYRVVGVQLEVSPAALAVPKGIAGSVNVRLSTGADGVSGDLGDGAWVERTLRGPSFAARRVVGRPNEPLLLPQADVARLSKVECPAHALDFGKSSYVSLRRATDRRTSFTGRAVSLQPVNRPWFPESLA